MATYNIEMNRYNGSTYDTLYPKANMANITGILPIANGGTGSSTIEGLVSDNNLSKIEFNTYKGSGTSGASAPNSITFSFAPKFVILLGYWDDVYEYFTPLFGYYGPQTYSYYFSCVIPMAGLTTSYKSNLGFMYQQPTPGASYASKNSSGDTVYWYCTNSTLSGLTQCNDAQYTYYYVAIG